MDNSQRLARLQAAIDNKPFNPPIPRLTISQRDELRALVGAGRVDDALGELSYLSNVAWEKILEKAREHGRRHNKQILEEKLLRTQIAKAESDVDAVIAINKPDERQADTEQAIVKVKTSKPRQKGDQDKLRTKHFMGWLKQNNNASNKTHAWIDFELRKDRPDLWGKNIETFRAWLKTSWAKEANELLRTIKLDARRAGKITEKQETGR